MALQERSRETTPKRHQLEGWMSMPGSISIPLKKVSKRAERNKTEKSEATETERETPMNSFVFCRYELSVSTQQTTQQAHLINLSLISPVYFLVEK